MQTSPPKSVFLKRQAQISSKLWARSDFPIAQVSTYKNIFQINHQKPRHWTWMYCMTLQWKASTSAKLRRDLSSSDCIPWWFLSRISRSGIRTMIMLCILIVVYQNCNVERFEWKWTKWVDLIQEPSTCQDSWGFPIRKQSIVQCGHCLAKQKKNSCRFSGVWLWTPMRSCWCRSAA